MSIGKNIAKYRKALSITQEELGARLGVTNQAVSKWESEVSMPDIMLLPQIASVLGVSLEMIYGIVKEPEKNQRFCGRVSYVHLQKTTGTVLQQCSYKVHAHKCL